MFLRQIDCLQRFSQRADLIHFDQVSIRHTLGIPSEEILHSVTKNRCPLVESFSERRPLYLPNRFGAQPSSIEMMENAQSPA